jgi:signal transduction histidine kinase
MSEQTESVSQQASIDHLRQQNITLMQDNNRLRARLESADHTARISKALLEFETLDVIAVQEEVLRLITQGLGYERAQIAHYDLQNQTLTDWRCSCQAMPEIQCIPEAEQFHVTPGSGVIAEAVAAERPLLVTDGRAATDDPRLHALIALQHYMVLPLVLRDQVFGVLLVDNPHSQRALTENDLQLLSNMSEKIAVLLLSLQINIYQAHHLVAEAERSHNVSTLYETLMQRLYGLTYSLTASLKLVPSDNKQLISELTYLQTQVQEAQATLRHALINIWPDQLDDDCLARELQAYVNDAAPHLAWSAAIDSHYNTLPLAPRQQIYRVAGDTLAHVLNHAASQVSVTLNWSPTALKLAISYDGPAIDLAAEAGAALETMQPGPWNLPGRVKALGGSFQITSQPDTQILIQLPIA